MDSREVGARKRMLLDRNKMQARVPRRSFPPGLPGSEKVQPGAKAGLDNGESPAATPAFGNSVALQENVPGFGQRARSGCVHVIELRRIERAVRTKRRSRRNDGLEDESNDEKSKSFRRTQSLHHNVTLPQCEATSTKRSLPIGSAPLQCSLHSDRTCPCDCACCSRPCC